MPGGERDRAWAGPLRPHRVLDLRPVRPGELRLVLAPVAPDGTSANSNGRRADRARPGQYWVLHTEHGSRIPAVDVTATASMVPAPSGGQEAAASTMEVSTLRVPCGPPIGVGDRVGVRGPLGAGWDLDGAAGRNLLLIAWESGLTLLRPLIEHGIAANRARRGAGRIRVWVGGHSWRAIPYRREWARWAGSAGVTVSAGPVLSMTTAVRDVDLAPAGTWAMLAGPLPMARATADALVGRGLPATRIQMATHHLIRCGDRRCGRCQIPAPQGTLRACDDGPVIGYRRLAGVAGDF